MKNPAIRSALLVPLASLLALCAASHAEAAERAGVLAAVSGPVTVERDDAAGFAGRGGAAIQAGDTIRTGPDARLQIILRDGSAFTLAPGTEFRLDRFDFNPQTGDGVVETTLLRGLARFATGRISDGNPDSFRMRLENATVGVRGTIGLAAVLTPTQAQQQFPDQGGRLGLGQGVELSEASANAVFGTPLGFGSARLINASADAGSAASPRQQQPTPSNGAPDLQVGQLSVPLAGPPIIFAALVGPGPLSQTNANTGSFNFSTPNGDVDLNRPGAAVLASPNQPPVFFIAPPGSIQSVTSGLSGDGSQGNVGGNSNSGDAAGSQDAGTGGAVDTGQAEQASGGSPISTTSVIDNLDQTIQNQQQAGNTVDSADLNTNAAQQSALTLQQLVASNSGTGEGSVPLTGTITGTFDYFFDFAARTFDMQATNLNGGGLVNSSIVVQGGSAALPGDTRTELTVGNNGQDFAATTGAGCGACSISATFPGSNQINATVSNGASSGTTGDATFE